MDRQIIRIDQISNEKWLNLYKIIYKSGDYIFTSRKDKKDLVALTSVSFPDAVRVLPFLIKNDKTYVVFIKEFRNPLNKYIYALPAGLIDNKENPTVAAERELAEEIGATTKTIEPISNCLYTTAGMSDESIMLFQAEVILNQPQHLEETEDITIKLVELSKIPEFLKNNDFCMCSYLMAKEFYYENINNRICTKKRKRG